MATRTATITYGLGGARAALVEWTGLLNGDDGSPVDLIDYPDRCVQFTGTFGVGGSVTVEGSNDGTNYVALTDPQGNAITKTAAAIEQIVEVPRYIRPRVTAGDGTTAIAVNLVARKA